MRFFVRSLKVSSTLSLPQRATSSSSSTSSTSSSQPNPKLREMSAGGQATRSREIPAVRRVAVHDAAHMPQDYSTTPGGTLFSTTPGGTRIIYDRKFLLQCRTSPLTRTPPNLPDIPGVTRPLKPNDSPDANQLERTPNNNTDHCQHTESAGEDAQFEMDI